MTGLPPFHNEPLLELRRSSERERLLGGLEWLDRRDPLSAAIVVAGERRDGNNIVSCDPSDPGRIIALAPQAAAADVDEALQAAQEGFRMWSQLRAAQRAAILTSAASWMRERRERLAAMCVRECAKPWAEADADVCEAIDFLEFYARQAIALEGGPPLPQVAGERNALSYRPRGIAAVIAPWNFPLAIPTGMTAAALAAGNAAVLKPAEQSPGCGALVVEALHAGGVPAQALSLLQGDGAVGAALVADPRVAIVAFTGSVAVGRSIMRACADPVAGQLQLKRVIAEMGGKNCVIVDSDADLDEAIPAILTSAFSYAGQKCSAASRIMVHRRIFEAFVERLAGAAQLLQVGPAADFATDVPALIEQQARDRVARYAQQAVASGKLIASADAPEHGWFHPPMAVAQVDPEAPVLREEVFGPLLTIEQVRDIGEACDRVDALPVALTGGLFSRNPQVIREVVARSPVGNLYVNRAITGAKVGRQPFGGNRLSGTGAKAGGPDYLQHFAEPQVVTENTMRHGLPI
jgi:RHH-type proline utilization regulon transcriptional repressor/proline dehydrogenase/delta 1-pyrroline-5-carboxylate dehydrogenase